jgi:hypothetical protein
MTVTEFLSPAHRYLSSYRNVNIEIVVYKMLQSLIPDHVLRSVLASLNR